MDSKYAALPIFLQAAILLMVVTEAINEGLDFISPFFNFPGYCQ